MSWLAIGCMATTPPVPILAKGQTETGRVWVYVRDDWPFGGKDPPAALFYASRDRTREHPERHLAGYAGIRSNRRRPTTRQPASHADHFSRFVH